MFNSSFCNIINVNHTILMFVIADVIYIDFTSIVSFDRSTIKLIYLYIEFEIGEWFNCVLINRNMKNKHIYNNLGHIFHTLSCLYSLQLDKTVIYMYKLG